MKQVLYVLMLVGIGFFIGRSMVNEVDPVIKHIKGDTIHDTVDIVKLVPVDVKIPKVPDLPTISDTMWLTDTFMVTSKVDTVAILADYILARTYNDTLFNNDTSGTLEVLTLVQYNKLGKLEYKFTPIRVERTIHDKRLLVPFAKTSINTYKYFSIGGGIYINDFGVGVDYVNDMFLEDPGWELSVIKKF